MTHFLRLLLIAFTVALTSCTSMLPTGTDIDNTLQEQLKSVEGRWRGMTVGTSVNAITLDFSLTQSANGQVQGSGTMKEAQAAAPVPITVTGSFHRPTLTLSFAGMIYEERAVSGAFKDDYTTVSGVSGPLHLTAEGYSTSITVLIQEQ